jgi:hypothetical protein
MAGATQLKQWGEGGIISASYSPQSAAKGYFPGCRFALLLDAQAFLHDGNAFIAVRVQTRTLVFFPVQTTKPGPPYGVQITLRSCHAGLEGTQQLVFLAGSADVGW